MHGQRAVSDHPIGRPRWALLPDTWSTCAAPSTFTSTPAVRLPRLATDRQVTEAACQMGFGGLLFKCHHESTVSRAAALQGFLPRNAPLRRDRAQPARGRHQWPRPSKPPSNSEPRPSGCRPSTPPTTRSCTARRGDTACNPPPVSWTRRWDSAP